MKLKYISIAALAAASVLLSSCVYYPGDGYGTFTYSTNGYNSSVAWTSASYDANGFPIFGYSYGRPVYGYTEAGVAIFTLAALTALCFVPHWKPAPWYHGGWSYPAHIHRVAAPPHFPSGHRPGVRPPGGMNAPIHRNPESVLGPRRDGSGNRPGMGNQPNRPNMGNQPNRPNMGNQPNRPNMGNQPNRPNMGNQPNRPNMGNQPNRPNMGNQPNRPNMGNQPNRPNMGNQPNRPNMGNQPNRPNNGARPGNNGPQAGRQGNNQPNRPAAGNNSGRNVNHTPINRPQISGSHSRPQANAGRPSMGGSRPSLGSRPSGGGHGGHGGHGRHGR